MYTVLFYSYPVGPDEDQKFIDVRMNAVKRKILILSGKGGMWSSTTYN